MDIGRIRNFCIIAHIDHGKSTLADRMLLLTGAVNEREFKNQMLDDMDLERERGITIKARATTLRYKRDDGEYELNLIDTPGHVDFSYEVSRSMAACEGALLLVDASQGVEAQTMANAYLAIEANLEIIPVINKVDLPMAMVEDTREAIEHFIGLPAAGALQTSGKTGKGVQEVLDTIVELVPSPKGDFTKPLRALIFDSVFDDYRGVIVYVRLIDGVLKKKDKIKFLANGAIHDVDEVGQFTPKMTATGQLGPGQVGYIIAGIKTIQDVKTGDTITHPKSEITPLPGFIEPQSMVFCGLYPTNHSDYEALRRALDKLKLNDASLNFIPETSEALGLGFRCGFLGLLHMEIAQERLERESNVDLVQTTPNVTYEVLMSSGKTIEIHSPAELPDITKIEEVREPMVKLSLIIPTDSIGPIMTLCDERRGKYVKTDYINQTRVMIVFEMPMAEILFDFYDKLKSATRGYGTMDYEFIGYKADDLVKLTILVNGVEVDALSIIVHRDFSETRGRRLIRSLQKEIPRHMFEIPLQAAIGGKIVARETIRALRKDVLAKCYGGDVTRKRKLLEKQKAGKKRMKTVGNVEIPQKAFLAALTPSEEKR